MAFIMVFTTRMCRNSVFIAARLAKKVIFNLPFFPCDLPPWLSAPSFESNVTAAQKQGRVADWWPRSRLQLNLAHELKARNSKCICKRITIRYMHKYAVINYNIYKKKDPQTSLRTKMNSWHMKLRPHICTTDRFMKNTNQIGYIWIGEIST